MPDSSRSVDIKCDSRAPLLLQHFIRIDHHHHDHHGHNHHHHGHRHCHNHHHHHQKQPGGCSAGKETAARLTQTYTRILNSVLKIFLPRKKSILEILINSISTSILEIFKHGVFSLKQTYLVILGWVPCDPVSHLFKFVTNHHGP